MEEVYEQFSDTENSKDNGRYEEQNGDLTDRTGFPNTERMDSQDDLESEMDIFTADDCDGFIASHDEDVEDYPDKQKSPQPSDVGECDEEVMEEEEEQDDTGNFDDNIALLQRENSLSYHGESDVDGDDGREALRKEAVDEIDGIDSESEQQSQEKVGNWGGMRKEDPDPHSDDEEVKDANDDYGSEWTYNEKGELKPKTGDHLPSEGEPINEDFAQGTPSYCKGGEDEAENAASVKPTSPTTRVEPTGDPLTHKKKRKKKKVLLDAKANAGEEPENLESDHDDQSNQVTSEKSKSKKKRKNNIDKNSVIDKSSGDKQGEIIANVQDKPQTPRKQKSRRQKEKKSQENRSDEIDGSSENAKSKKSRDKNKGKDNSQTDDTGTSNGERIQNERPKTERQRNQAKSKARERTKTNDSEKTDDSDQDNIIDAVSITNSRPQSERLSKSNSLSRDSSGQPMKRKLSQKSPRSSSSEDVFDRLHRSDTISYSGSAVERAPKAEDIISKVRPGTELKDISERLYSTPTRHSKFYKKPRARDIISRPDMDLEEIERAFDRLYKTDTVSFSGHAPLLGPMAIDEISREVYSGGEVRAITKRLNKTHTTASSAGSQRCRLTPELPPPGYGQKMYPEIKGIETRFRGMAQLEYPQVSAAVTRLYTGHTKASKSRLDAPVSERPAFLLREYLYDYNTNSSGRR